ncbi:MAG TPA: protein kinase [Vicinamibacteria bacterium]|nr:protein kinase [Vicinamibacteria bacterium]
MPPPQDPALPESDEAPTIGLGGATPVVAHAAGVRLAEGDVLGGRFRVTRLLGEGGMGQVYEAEDLELGERVALKTIRAEIAGDARAMERFKREVHLARRVTHPNVCRLFDLGRHQGKGEDITFLTMELLAGETLADRLRRGPLGAEEAGRLARQMAEALAAAHRAGIVHRDFKPGNVILTAPPDPRAVVTDFGLAGLSGEGPATVRAGSLVAGTPAYMAPEQETGGTASPAGDVYSFGRVLVEMLRGRPGGKEAVEALPPEARQQWGDVLGRCLAGDPAHRFRTAVELLAALRGEAVSARPLRRAWVLGAAGLALLAAAVWWAGRGGAGQAPPRPARVAPVQITTSSGLDIHPRFSPDGKWLAYSSDRGGSFQIYLKQLPPGTAEVQLTTAGENFQPAWAPDGRALAYHAKGGGIWVAPAAGGPARQLTRFGSHPAWSPDGTRLAFQSEPLVDLGANAFPAVPPSTLWVVDGEGGEPRPLTRQGVPAGGHGAPSWSPDGRRIVFGAADRRLAEVWSVSADGSDLLRLVHDQPYAFDPVYSADGTRVFYSSYSRFLYGIWSVPVSAEGRPRSAPAEVASLGLPRLRHLAVSRDGRHIAYSSLTLMSNLWWLPLSPQSGRPAGAPQALTHGTGKLGRPALSPDGTRVAYDRAQSGMPEHLWVSAVDGSGARGLTHDDAEHNLPSWFPSGDRLAYLRNQGGRFSVWWVTLDGSGQGPLLEVEQDIDYARLSPDATRVAFNSKKDTGTVNTWVADVAGGAPRPLTSDAEMMGFPCWSPDGSLLAIEVKRGPHTHVAVLPSGGGAPVQLTAEEGQSWPFSFSPDGGRIAFAGLRDGLWNVWTVSRADRRQQRLTAHDRLNAYVRTPAWSPRGDRLVYEYAETAGNIWMIDSPP